MGHIGVRSPPLQSPPAPPNPPQCPPSPSALPVSDTSAPPIPLKPPPAPPIPPHPLPVPPIPPPPPSPFSSRFSANSRCTISGLTASTGPRPPAPRAATAASSPPPAPPPPPPPPAPTSAAAPLPGCTISADLRQRPPLIRERTAKPRPSRRPRVWAWERSPGARAETATTPAPPSALLRERKRKRGIFRPRASGLRLGPALSLLIGGEPRRPALQAI